MAEQQSINVEVELFGASCPGCEAAIAIHVHCDQSRVMLESFAQVHSLHTGFVWRGRITAPPMMASDQVIELALGGGLMKTDSDEVAPPVPMLPCPFCGHRAVLTRLGGTGSTHGWIECVGCRAGQPYKPTFEAACSNWNRREKA
jgi:hypothetical protein